MEQCYGCKSLAERIEQTERALDAERERVKELEKRLAEEHPGLDEACEQLATLQAQLRQVEGERDAADAELHRDMVEYCQFAHEIALPGTRLPEQVDDSISFGKLKDVVNAIVAERDTLRQLVEAFRSSEEWGAVKAWMVEGAPTRQEGVEAAKRITKAQYEMENALVVCRQALAAQDAGKEDASHD